MQRLLAQRGYLEPGAHLDLNRPAVVVVLALEESEALYVVPGSDDPDTIGLLRSFAASPALIGDAIEMLEKIQRLADEVAAG